MHENLTDRKSRILTATVEDFIKTAAPVPSTRVSEVHRIALSPASIRNTMATLEKEGYLYHPHTSSGKVPTDKGYRTYVTELMVVEDLDRGDRTLIERTLDEISGSVDQHLQILSQILSKISGSVGIAIAADMMSTVLVGIRLVHIRNNRILFVLELDSGTCRTVVAEIEHEHDDSQLIVVEDILRDRLCGLSLREIIATLAPRLSDLPEDSVGIIRFIQNNSQALFNDDGDKDIYIYGLENIIRSPEFNDQDNVGALVSLVEDEARLRSLFANVETDEIGVTIGSEHGDDRLATFATISSNIGGASGCGTLAVLAPKRVEYSRVISALGHITRLVKNL